MKYEPFPYQDHCTDHIIKKPAGGLFVEMGLGKTVATLTAIIELMFNTLEVAKVLVVAPKKVADWVWEAEIKKWDHLKYLKIVKVLGTEKQRKKALQQKAHIHIINRENVAWLVSYLGGSWPWDMLVIDELSSFKNPAAIRFKALRQVRPKITRVVGLTGTPSPNGLIDLWSQLYLLDQGERLGKNITGYREQYFVPDKTNGHIVYKYKPNKEADKIYGKISDICISMKKKDYLDLPERIDRTVMVHLPAEIKKQYDLFEEDQVMQVRDTQITAVSAGALAIKLLQFANGAVYDEDSQYHVVHNEKIEVLKELVEACNGNPVLIGYAFRHDKERILKAIKEARELKTENDYREWNKGNIPVMIMHPASAGHGLNLQFGGSRAIWFSHPYSLELYQQFNDRIHRIGQQFKTIFHHLVTVGTIDLQVMEVLAGKIAGQDALMDAVKAIIKKYE